MGSNLPSDEPMVDYHNSTSDEAESRLTTPPADPVLRYGPPPPNDRFRKLLAQLAEDSTSDIRRYRRRVDQLREMVKKEQDLRKDAEAALAKVREEREGPPV